MSFPDGIRELNGSETQTIVGEQHKDWNSLDEYVESAAMTMVPDAHFESRGQVYALMVDGTSIVSRYDEPSAEDRYRLSSCGVVIYRGDRQKPLYFTNRDEGLTVWDRLCIDMGHLEGMFKDELPPAGNVYLN